MRYTGVGALAPQTQLGRLRGLFHLDSDGKILLFHHSIGASLVVGQHIHMAACLFPAGVPVYLLFSSRRQR